MPYVRKIHSLLDRNTKKGLVWLVFFSIFISMIEAIGVSAIMPFIDVATNFSVIQENQYYSKIFIFFSFESEISFAIAFGFLLVVFYILRGALNWLYSYAMAKFSNDLYAQTTQKLFTTYLSMPYQVFVKKNSSYLTKTIVTEASLISSVVNSTLLMISEVFVVVFLYVLMFTTSWSITLALTVILFIKTALLTKTISKKVKKVGVLRANVQAKLYEAINRVLGNFKHIKLQNQERLKNVERNFSMDVCSYAKANTSHVFLSAFPRLFLETSGFILVVILLMVLLYYNQSDVSYILPTLSLFVLALYRLLPSVNRIVSGYNALMYRHKAIDIVNSELQSPQESLGNKSIEFDHKIELSNIDFSYHNQPILNKVNLVIEKGESVAFVGESGSGKSTLVDLIIGLHMPNEGCIKIDQATLNNSNLQDWRSQIGYISQHVYLFDGTIADNVCFGRELDFDLLEEVLKQANAYDFLQEKQGVETPVGEGGIQLSGGQKQRIAIARALYGKPEVLVLDEATSALDDKTELRIMNEIYQISKNKTLIIIAHRLSTITGCSKVFKVVDGSVLKQ